MFERVSGYVASLIAVELDGKYVGFVPSASGGETYADVVTGRDATGSPRKCPGPPKTAPIVINAGAYVAEPLYRWVAAAMAGRADPRSGALVFFGNTAHESWRLEFSQATIAKVVFPAMDSAVKKEATIEITIEPEATK